MMKSERELDVSNLRQREGALDEVDRVLVGLLVADGRRTVADMAGRVSLSQPAVKRRVDRLVGSGVITHFTAAVDHHALGWCVEAFTELRYVGSTSPGAMEALAYEISEVEAVYSLAGDCDALCRVRARDIHHLRDVVARLRATTGVTGTKTLLVLGGAEAAIKWWEEP